MSLGRRDVMGIAASGLLLSGISKYVVGTTKTDQYVLKVYDVPLEHYLTSEARKLYDTPIDNTLLWACVTCHLQVRDKSYCKGCGVDLRETGTRVPHPVQYCAKEVPLRGLTVPDEYARRWAAALNLIAEKGYWHFGTLAKAKMLPMHKPDPYTLRERLDATIAGAPLPKHELEPKGSGVLLTIVGGGDVMSSGDLKLNAELGFNIFSPEGELHPLDGWEKFPTLT